MKTEKGSDLNSSTNYPRTASLRAKSTNTVLLASRWNFVRAAFWYTDSNGVQSRVVGPCHHDMARPRVADGGTASSYAG
jgi:hypothetical protein